jgi:FkbM family methyltransferase
MADIKSILQTGWEVHQKGDLKQAEAAYAEVLRQNPRNANAWCYVGILKYDQHKYDEAVPAYENAIRLSPAMPEAYNNLGNALRMQGRVEESLRAYDQAIMLRPVYPNAYMNKGAAYTWDGRVEQAVECFEKSIDQDEENSDAHKNLGVALLLLGEYERGGEEYEWRRKAENLIDEDSFTCPEWDGSDPKGKHILLQTEQGLGDCLQFIRYATVLKERGAKVSARVSKALLPLLQRFDGLEQLTSKSDPPPECDAWVPMLSVPFRQGEFQLEDVPSEESYLTADPELIEQWKERLDAFPGMKISVAWQGNPNNATDEMRSFPLESFAPLDRIHGVTLINLQKGRGEAQIAQCGNQLTLIQLGDDLDEEHGAFMDTAAVMKNLDLVITADTATGHLAAALGVPVWIVLPCIPDWRWTREGDTTPWYPSARLFRQTKSGEWGDVFQNIANTLVDEFDVLRWKRPEEHQRLESGVSRVTRARYGLMTYLRKDIYIGRSIDLYGEFSEGEVDLFRQLLKPGQTVIEAGSNIGVHTVPLAQIVGLKGAVYAFEPQRVVYQALCANLAQNGIYNVMASLSALGSHGKEGRTVVIPDLNYGAENNFGGLSVQTSGQGQRVPLATIDSLNIGSCALIKADVEGMELDVLRGGQETIAKHHPILYVENDRDEGSQPLLQFIADQGYTAYWHFPPLYAPSNYFMNQENVFPGLVSANLLCVHSSVRTAIQGLKRVESPSESWRDVLNAQRRQGPAS